ncbi:MAG: hypothetical protein ACRDP1_10400 [Nocardioidaceae bacterium]
MSAARKPGGLRAALAAKRSRVSHFDVPQVDSDVADAKAAEFRQAVETLGMVRYSDDAAAIGKAEKVVAGARKALAACFYRVSFTGLSEVDFDALVNAHPPTAEQAEAGASWNDDTFTFALIEASIVDGDGMGADDWRAELDSPRWTRADRAAFIRAALDANQREFSAGIPKG